MRKGSYFYTEHMAVGYHGEALIRDICLEIEQGEIIVLMGPNGSGKSTILKSIAKQIGLIGGKAVLNGADIRNMSFRELAGKMAVVLTERVRPELMTCREVVAMGRYPYTGRLGILDREDERQVRSAMEAVDILDIAERAFLAVSDGQRQRTLLARAICQEPEMILLDEPASFLDIRHKIEILDILRRMAREKQMTVLLSLHEIDLAQKCADKIICVKGDQIAGYGTPEEIFTEERIRKLYDLEEGSYDPVFGSTELKKPQGKPEILVLSTGGNGVGVYRRLQRENRPFIAGVLYPGETDYQAARYLAAEIIEEQPFEEISEETCRKAKQAVDSCSSILNAGVTVGSLNRRMTEILEYAEKSGKMRVSGV